MNNMDNLFDEIKNMIDKATGEAGREFSLGKFEGLGWLDFHYSCSTYDGLYPRIALKQYANAVHFYAMLWIDGKSVIEDYSNVFGKSSVGKGCIRIKKLTDERRDALLEIIQIAIAINTANN
jgi:hypothetical protein